jgi:hypothetical protein
MGCPELFHSKDIQDELQKYSWELEKAEGILSRAIQGTSVKWLVGREYDPEKILKGLLSGRICPNFGTLSRSTLRFRSKRKQSRILFCKVDYLPYALSGLDSLPHYAYFRSGKITIGYLEEDRGKINPILDKMNGEEENKPLLFYVKSN